MSENGITLIALVLTIIILLILAGVSLNLVSGSNGILNRTTSAVNATKQAQLEEELQLSLAEIMMDYYMEGNGKTLQEYIIEKCNKSENNGMLEVGNGTFSSIDGDLYYTDSNGNISMIQVTDKGEVSIEGSVSADGTVNDTNPPSIFATATTNAISLVIKDPLSGIAGWAYSTTNAEPNEWNEVSGKPKSFNETITGLTNGTTYYIWVKDANGNKSQVKEVTTKNFDELSYDITWEGAMATITVKKPTTGVQYLNTAGNWVDYTMPVTVEGGTTVQFKVTDGNNEKSYEAVKPTFHYTLNYHANGGEGTMIDSIQEYGTASTLPANAFTKVGCAFMGWATDAEKTMIDYKEGDTVKNLTTNKNITLYAVWKKLAIGDTIMYQSSGTYNWQGQYASSDGASDVFLNSNSGKSYSINSWKILDINGSEVTLVPVSPTEGEVRLFGTNGYNNAVKLLNDACSSLYENSSKGIMARSIRIEDIESRMTSEALSMVHSSSTSIATYGQPCTIVYTNARSYPSIYEQETNRIIDTVRTNTGLGLSEQTSFVTGSAEASTSIQPVQTYWGRDSNDMISAFVNNKYFDVLLSQKTYWIASRCCDAVFDTHVYFAVRLVLDGGVIEARDMSVSGYNRC